MSRRSRREGRRCAAPITNRWGEEADTERERSNKRIALSSMSYADRATSAPLRQTGWLTPTNWLAHRNKLFCAGIQPRTGTTSWFLGQGGACEEATSPRAVTSTQPSSHHRSAVYRQLPAAGRAEHPADAPWALAPCFLHPTPLMGGNSLRASPVEFSANPRGRSWPARRHTRARASEA